MNCPNCKVNLMITHRDSIEIDYCPECRGVWLDRGELDKIIERTVVSHPYNDSHKNGATRRTHPVIDNHYKKRKRDSFFGDLFDF